MNLKSFLKTLKLNESSISAVLGAIVVVIVGILVVNYFKGKEGSVPSGLSGGVTEYSLPLIHAVLKGDNLWKIAEKYYGSGYNWIDIANENNLSNASLIEEGQGLIIPDIEAKLATVVISENVNTDANVISETTYEVVKGDSLWDIAVRAYGDGYKWVELAQENKLTNPNVIHPGNILTLAR